MFRLISTIAVVLALFLILAPRCIDADELPPPAGREIDFHKDVAPILYRSCTKCHTGKDPKGGLRMETRALLLAGGESDEVVAVGNSAESLLIQLVAGWDKDRVMPAQGPRLTGQQIGILRAWIDQGLKWEEGFRFGSSRQASVAPRPVELPAAAEAGGAEHPVDRLLHAYFQRHNVDVTRTAEDRVFIRRASLDLIGLLPSPEAVRAFEQDQRPDKRARLIEALLADDEAYAIHWLTFWNDALRNAYRGTGYIDGGRKQITPWLYKSLGENKPYDQFVHELVSPVPGSEGFIKGIVWRGVVNSSQRPEMQAAQNISQVFLGTNLKCASCHDSFINDWKLADSYSLAAVFANGPLEIHRCNKPTGETAQVGFLYPQLGQIDPQASKPERMRQLADALTSRKNGRLARTIVNRLWAQLFGRGIVEPVDDMDQTPLDADLLDWLAVDLAAHDYDLKHTLRLLCTSRAYQLHSVGAPRPEQTDFVFRGPIVKRMTAEQFVDAVNTLTGQWPAKADVNLPALAAKTTKTDAKTGVQLPALAAQWIWSGANAARADAGGPVYFRKRFTLPAAPKTARAVLTCDNAFTLWVNGAKLAVSENWQTPLRVDLARHLQAGENVVAVQGVNFPSRPTGQGLKFNGPNPAGLIFFAVVEGEGRRQTVIASDKSWRWAEQPPDKWTETNFDDGKWPAAAELGDQSAAPWSAGEVLAAALRGSPESSPAATGRHIRAALLNDDALTRALGRTNREQVLTRRQTLATTLQLLELSNGSILDEKIKAGARRWHGRSLASSAELVTAVYLQAIGREPTESEQAIAVDLVGRQATPEGIADLLWVVVMLPEFQLVY